MAQPKSKRRSRKRRGKSAAGGAAKPAAPPKRGERLAGRGGGEELIEADRGRRATRGLDARGERPESPFGGLPVSELAIFVGAIAFVVGLLNQGGPALVAGIVICGLGVLEVTAREHFSGYRSHALLLAAFPSVVIELVLVQIVGGGPSRRAVLVGVVAPVFLALAWALRRRYRVAHLRRTVRAGRG